jgi:predicted phage terminase large subunit-like protein
LAQYQQTPTADEGAIVKKEWWKKWESSELPECQYILQSWDTAFSQKTSADFSACTTWGVFYKENSSGRKVPNVILLHSYRDRMEFPALKRRFMDLNKDWRPDTTIIEGRSSGQPLIFELRAMGIAVEEVTVGRGSANQSNDKLTRVNGVADLFQSGMIWYIPNKMNEYVIEEFSDFPAGRHDDLVDSSTQALLRLREGMFISSTSDAHRIYADDDDDDGGYRRSRRLY